MLIFNSYAKLRGILKNHEDNELYTLVTHWVSRQQVVNQRRTCQGCAPEMDKFLWPFWGDLHNLLPVGVHLCDFVQKQNDWEFTILYTNQ